MTTPAPPVDAGGDTSWRRYRLIADQSLDVVYETDSAGEIVWISPSVHDLLGWDPDQLQGRPGHDLAHPLDLDRIDALRADLDRTGLPHDGVTCMVRTATGGYRQVTLRARPMTDHDGHVTGAIVTLTDTHDRDSALRALATLSRANRILVRATDEAALLDRMCQALIETGRYALAWYGRPVDDDARSVVIAASAGELDYLDQVTVSWGDTPQGQGPTGRCLRTGETQVQNRFAEDPEYRPWSDAATRHGFGCSISLPVLVHDAIDGALMVYADEPGAFDALAQELLEDLAADLGYGIERLRNLADLARTTRLESQQRQRLQSTLDSMIDPFIIMDAVRDDDGTLIDLRYTDANAAAVEYNQIPREQLIGARLLDLFPGQLEHGPLRRYFHAIETGEPVILDDYAYGHEVLAEERRYDIRATQCGDGLALTWRDVTDRHTAASRLAESERRYRLLAENASDVILLADAHTTLKWVSASSLQTLGWAPDDLIGHTATEFIHPEDLPGLVAAVSRSTESGETIRPRYRWRRPDGTYRWMEAVGRPFDDDGTGTPGRVVSLRDIDDEVRAEERLAASERQFRLLAENSSDVVILASNPDAACLWVSPSVERMLGWTPEDFLGRLPADFLHPDDVAAVDTGFAEAMAHGQDLRQEYRLRCADGTYRWVEALTHRVPAATPDEARLVVRLRDIADQVRAEEALAAREERYRLLAENASDIVWQVSPDGTLTWTSPAVTPVLGWAVEDVLGTIAMDLVHPDDRERAIARREHVVGGHAEQGEYRMLQADGSTRWMSLTVHPVATPNGVTRVLSLRDIEEEVSARTMLEFALGHDQATGLPTRQGMLDRIAYAQSQLPEPRALAVLCVGIDALGEVNEALSHSAGDIVVRTVAARVAQSSGVAELVGRGTGDEFIVILPDLADGLDALATAEAIRRAVHGAIEVAGHHVSPTVSVGIATGDRRADPDTLLRDASLALRDAKEAGRDRCAFVDPTMVQTAEHRLALETAIRDGLAAGEFVPWFQPIVSLADGSVSGYEALARWRHVDGTVEPNDFIPIAARTSLISEIDLAMLDPVVAALAELPEPTFIAVNVTGQTLTRTAYADLVTEVLQTHGVRPGRLHLEITETMLLALNDDVVGQMRSLADLGCRWYVDDFGTGYSSISHLRDLPVSGLKLDQSFTRGIGAGEETSRQLADALMGLANGLGLDTVAEGVETIAEASYLRTVGWRHGQGWLYGKAEPLA